MRAPQSGPLWTVDASDSWLAAGAEETIYIWDKRNSSTVAAGLEDTHGEAVTCCRFDPADPSLLLTCSVDGQIAVTDMRELHNEDESFKVPSPALRSARDDVSLHPLHPVSLFT